MALRFREFVEFFLFLTLTFGLYALATITLPIFRDPHGLLAMSDLSDTTQSGFVLELVYLSAVGCVLLGVLLLNWISQFNIGMMANLWATVFIFLWIDCLAALSLWSKSYRFLTALGVGLLFIYLFFYILHFLGWPQEQPDVNSGIKRKIVNGWLWFWMGFYFGLSCFLVYKTFEYPGFRWPIAAAALAVCFLHYLLYLFLKQTEGKDVTGISKTGRFFFGLWLLGLVVVWIGQQWLL